ncbi:MAG: PorP/SprF family type IX secretion system membrane protein [Pedobacter sp.]|nr:PorP/SprF family type IX secretion system membrane protein [Pedobacter sp.]
MKARQLKKYLLLGLCLMGSVTVKAQLNSLGNSFYQNQYLSNPAMAGMNEGLRLNVGLNQQWSAVPGSPSAQFITLDHRLEKVGVGISLYADKAGLLKRTRAVATYAYYLLLNENEDQLHFGISLGALSERLATEEINGSIADVSVQRFNERPVVMDGDFGIAYTSSNLTIQGTLPNLKNFLKKERYNTANWTTFFSSISYRFYTGVGTQDISIEPKISFRGVRGYDNIIDGGVNLTFTAINLSATAIYHSTESISMGLGFNYKKLSILGLYTSGTSALQGYSSGNFEIGLGYRFGK